MQCFADFADKVLETVPWNASVAVVVCLGQVRPHDVHTHLKVRLVEIIAHVPPHLTISNNNDVLYYNNKILFKRTRSMSNASR